MSNHNLSESSKFYPEYDLELGQYTESIVFLWYHLSGTCLRRFDFQSEQLSHYRATNT